MKKNSLLTLALSSFLGLQASAQSFGDYDWKSEMAIVEIPSKYADADAVVINNTTYSKGTFSGTYPYIEQLATYRTQVHVKIQKEAALEDYQQVIVQKFKGRIADYVQYKNVDIRVRKKDGKVIDYKVRDLKLAEIDKDDDLYDSREDLFVYEVPNLEVGDEIEMVNVLESKFLDQGRIVNLYGDYPTLSASYTISIPLKVGLKGSIYNGMPKPNLRKTSTNKIYKWTMSNLKAVPEANSSGTIFSKDLEYFVYELNFDAFRADALSFSVKNWSDLMWQYSEDFLKVRIRKKRKLQEFYDNLFVEGAKLFGKEADQLVGLEKMFLLNKYVVEKLQIVRELEDFEKSEGIDYFLINGKSDYKNMMRIYRDAFDRFEVEYYLAIGKNRFSGSFDMNFISSTQINSYFFIFKNGGGFSAINGTGCWGELPWNLANTKILMKDIRNRQSELKEINFKEVDLISKSNKKSSRSQFMIDLKKNTIIQKASSSYAGMYSRGTRGYIMAGFKADTLDKMLRLSMERNFRNNPDVKVSVANAKVSKIVTTPPYNFKYSYVATIENLLEEKEGTWTIKGEELIGNSVRWVSNAKKRQLDYHLPFLGKDVEDVYLSFNEDVVLVNAKDLAQKIENDYVSYELKITQLKPNLIRIQSIYQTKKLLVEKEKALLLDEANKAYEKVVDTEFLFKTN